MVGTTNAGRVPGGGAESGGMDWDVAPPPGWEPVADLCRGLYADRERLTDHINRLIQDEIEAFRPGSTVITDDDLRWSTGRGVANFLRGVAECRTATADEIAFQRLVGERSAIRALPLEPLISSFQVGFRELWSTLARVAMGTDEAAARLLLERGSIVWERLVSSTSAVAEGYKAELARRQAFETAATAHFIEALATDPGSDEARALAKEIGFDPDGAFRVIQLGGPLVMGETAGELVAALQASGAVASAAQHGRVAVVIAQGGRLDDALARAPADAIVGIGGEGSGLAGASASMSEAERALSVALVRRRASRFEDDWLPAMLFSQRDSIARLLEPGIRLARAKPHLASAVATFADAGFSVAEGARRLRVSPNSMRYRLVTWREATGWDPWTFDGLARSLVALDLASGPVPPGA